MAPSWTKRRKSTFSLFYAERSILSITYGRGDDMAHASRRTISTPPMTSSASAQKTRAIGHRSPLRSARYAHDRREGEQQRREARRESAHVVQVDDEKREREAVADAANERAEEKRRRGPRIDERKPVGTRLSTSFTRSSGYMSNIVRRITSVVKRLRRRELRLGR